MAPPIISHALRAGDRPPYNPAMHRPARTLAAVTAIAAASVLAGCSSGSTASTTTTHAAPTTTAPPVRPDDGVLKIGVLIPQGSANADIGEAIDHGVRLALDKINAAGGYGGQDVVLVPADEGAAAANVDPAITNLVDAGVDAIVGPASSLDALAGLHEIVEAGVVACSPTASASVLDNFPDHNLFFRTIPSDTLEAMAIAEAVDRTGASQAAVTYIDDDYGQTFVANVSKALRRKGIEQTAAIPYDPNNQSIASAAGRIAATGAGVVVVIGDATSGPVMLDAIDAAPGSTRPIYIVNDAMRRPTTSTEPFGGSLSSRVTGVSPPAFSSDEQFIAQLNAPPGDNSPYAANAYDCVNLIALAALEASSTQPTSIAAQIPSVSDSGTPCNTFVACRTGIQSGSNINYDGPGGPVSLNSNGDVAAATYDEFGFDSTGRDYRKGTVSVHE